MANCGDPDDAAGVRLRPGLRALDLAGELVLHDGADDSVHVLNASGRLIWNAHRRGETVEAIEAELREAFGADPGADLKTDILDFIERLKGKRILDP